MSRRDRKRHLPKLIAACGLLAAAPAYAADFWWAGDVNANWNTGLGGNTNFSSSGSANVNTTLFPGAADVLRFSVPGAGNLATTLGQDFSLLGLRLESGVGATSVSGNILTLGAAGVTNASTASLTLNSTLLASGSNYTFNPSSSGAIIVTGGLSGAGKGLVKTGPGTLRLSGINTFTGPAFVTAGTLELARSVGFSPSSPISVSSGATLLLSNNDTWDNHNTTTSSALTIAGTLASNNTHNTIISPTFAGGRLLLQGGPLATFPAFALKGTVTVSGSAETQFNAGGGVNNFINIGTSGVPGATTFDVADVTSSSAADLSINVPLQNNQNAAAAGAVASSLIKTGPGTLVLNAANVYTGGTTLAGGVTQFATAAALPATGPLTFTGGTLSYVASNLTDYAARIVGSTSSVRIDTQAHTVTFAGGLASSNTAGLTKLGTGLLVLNGTNPFSGPTLVRGGTLQTSFIGSLPNTSGVTVEGGTLRFGADDLWGNYQTSSTPVVTVNAGGIVASNNSYTTLVNPVFNGGTLLANGGANFNLPAFGLRGTVTVGGSSPSQFVVGTGTLNVILVGSPLANSVTTFNVADVTASSAADLTIAVPIQNYFDGFGQVSSGITKTGPGTLALTANNTFNGLVTLSAGTLQIGNGGTTGSVSSNIINNATLVFNRSDTVVFNNAMTGTGAITQSGTGSVILGNNLIFTGVTTIAAGSGGLQIGNGAGPGSHPGPIVNNASLTFNRTVDLTHAGTISGTGSVTKLNTNTLTFTGSHTFTGPLNVAGGRLVVPGGLTPSVINVGTGATPAGFSQTAGTVTVQGSVFLGTAAGSNGSYTISGGVLNAAEINAGFEGAGTVTQSGGSVNLGAGVALGVNTASTSGLYSLSGGQLSAPSVFVGVFGAGRFVQTGGTNTATTRVLLGVSPSAPSTYQLSGGTLATSSIQLGSSLATFDFNGGTLLALSNTSDYFNPLSLASAPQVSAGGARIDSGVFTVTLSAPLTRNPALGAAPDGGLTKLGSGTLVLTAGSTFTGPTTLAGGHLQLSSPASLSSDSTLVFTGGALRYVSTNLTDYSPRIVGSTSPVAIDTNDQSVTFASPLSTTNLAGLTKLGAGTLTLTADSPFTGPTLISGGSLRLGEGGTTGSVAGDILNNAALVLDRSGDYTLTNLLSGTGTLQKLGTGTVTFTADSPFTGPTTISAGTLRLGNGGPTGSVAGNIVNDSALIFDRTTTLTYSGGISGSGPVTKLNSNTLTFTGSHTFTGPLTVSDGRLIVGGDLRPSSVNVGAGASLTQLGGLSTFHGGITLGHSASASSSYEFKGGTIELPGGAIVSGDATARFLWDGGTFVVRQSTPALFSGISPLIGASGGAIYIEGNTTLSTPLVPDPSLGATPDGGLIKSGNSTLFLTAANSYTGLTRIIDGPLSVGNGGASGSIAGNIANQGNLIFNRTTNLTYPGSISGGGLVTKLNTNTVTFTGNNTFTGPLTVSGGEIRVAGNLSPWSITVGESLTASSLSQLGGSVVVTGSVLIAAGQTPSARYSISSGLLSAQILQVGRFGVGTFAQTGGTVNLSTYLYIGQFSSGLYTQSAGSFNAPVIYVGGNDHGRFIQTGGTSTITDRLFIRYFASAPSFYRLAGGTLAASRIELDFADGNENGFFEFNGGTLAATGNTSALFVNLAPIVSNRAAVFDTRGFTVTLNNPLRRNPALGTVRDGGLTKIGTGTLSLSAGNTYAGPTTVLAGTLVLNPVASPLTSPPVSNLATLSSTVALTGSPSSVAALRVATVTAVGTTTPTGSAVVRTANPVLLLLDRLTITHDGAPLGSRTYHGLLDLGTNDALIRNASIADLSDMARDFVASSGVRGIGSSASLPFARLAVVSNATDAPGVPFFGTFDGQPATASAVLARFTYTGDTNLDGRLDGHDLANFIEGFSTGATGWQNGDFDYNGVVNATDYALLAAGLAANLPPLGSPAGIPDGSGSIPEPAALVFLAPLASLLVRRRR